MRPERTGEYGRQRPACSSALGGEEKVDGIQFSVELLCRFAQRSAMHKADNAWLLFGRIFGGTHQLFCHEGEESGRRKTFRPFVDADQVVQIFKKCRGNKAAVRCAPAGNLHRRQCCRIFDCGWADVDRHDGYFRGFRELLCR